MIEIICSHLQWFWLGIMVLCIVVEAMTTFALVSIWGALSAFIMIFVSRSGMDFRWQLLLFLVMAILLVIFTRPFVMKKLKLGKNVTNVNTLEGQEVLVVKGVERFNKGEVKAVNGVIWAALALSGENIPEGRVCIIRRVDGNTLIVEPKQEENHE